VAKVLIAGAIKGVVAAAAAAALRRCATMNILVRFGSAE